MFSTIFRHTYRATSFLESYTSLVYKEQEDDDDDDDNNNKKIQK